MRQLLVIALFALAGCASPPPLEAVPTPAPETPSFSQTGAASWYGSAHQGGTTADGERYDMHAMTAAHRDLPFHTIARVTKIETGQSVKVRINDRGPNAKDRIIDLSAAAASALGMRGDGVVTVRVEVFSSDQTP